MSTYTGRNVTKQLHIETRQHEFLGLDLGEGPRRRDLLLGLVAFPIWAGLCWAIFGPPLKQTMFLYLAPPILLLTLGVQESERNPRRMKLTMGLMNLRYMFTGHRPVIRLGARKGTKNETLPAVVRFQYQRICEAINRPEWATKSGHVNWDHFATAPGMSWLSRFSGRQSDMETIGQPIHLQPRAYIYSTDELVRIAERHQTKNHRKAQH
ncbi:hypothetical protein [Rothia uropygialis]|uniref:hypothetical protein n=1 Tax=Kocuria sp. 36 TaxID=1415402 RepID=UPI00101BB73B|nr:hypothetical protein [Kocuria sp. 36]